MDKSAEAFRTISEVAEDLGIPKHVLRFWEVKFTQIKPMKRGGGRRYYRPEDMDLLRGVQHLLHRDGYTIKGVQRILREQGTDIVKQLGRGEEPIGGLLKDPGETPAGPGAASPAAEAPERNRKGRRKSALVGSDRAGFAAAITEALRTLEECRALLAGEKPEVATRASARARG